MKIIEPISVVPEDLSSHEFQVLPDYEVLVVQPDASVFEVLELSTNVPEDDHPRWAPGTYNAGDWVVHNRRVWEALNTTDKEPGSPGSEADWLDDGYTNRYRMFDNSIQSKTVNPDIIDVSIATRRPISSIAFFNVDAGSVRVRSIDPVDGIIFERSVAPVSTDGIDNWWAWFFEPVQLVKDFIISDIPSSSFGSTQITLTSPGHEVSVGEIVMGSLFDIGNTLHGSEFGIIDYTIKETDEFGQWTIIERGFSKRAEFDVAIPTEHTGAVQRKLANYRAKPLVWIGTPELEVSVVYGYYRDFSIIVSNPSYSEGTISVEGLN